MVFLDEKLGITIQGTPEEVYGLTFEEGIFQRTIGAGATIVAVAYVLYGYAKANFVYSLDGFFKK